MAKNYVTSFRGESYFTPGTNNLHIKDEPASPLSEDFGNYSLDYLNENDYSFMRKSLSMSDITSLRDDLMKLEFSGKDDAYRRCKQRPIGRSTELSKTKFVSMAEAIYHYHRDTPERFHSRKSQILRQNVVRGPSGLTVPQSPMLRSKARSRPVHILSQKEKEEMEIEEIKKYKIKAQPIPKSIKEEPKLPEVSKKPLTVPEPFHLTEVQKKTVSSAQIHKFKARSAPKHIFEKPQVLIKNPVHITKPVSPKWHYKKSKSVDHTASEKTQSQKFGERNHQRPVKSEPFSFQKRDEELKKRKEERIKHQIEQDRKQARQFKAQPLPGAIKKRVRCEAMPGCSSSKICSGNKENHV